MLTKKKYYEKIYLLRLWNWQVTHAPALHKHVTGRRRAEERWSDVLDRILSAECSYFSLFSSKMCARQSDSIFREDIRLHAITVVLCVWWFRNSSIVCRLHRQKNDHRMEFRVFLIRWHAPAEDLRCTSPHCLLIVTGDRRNICVSFESLCLHLLPMEYRQCLLNIIGLVRCISNSVDFQLR